MKGKKESPRKGTDRDSKRVTPGERKNTYSVLKPKEKQPFSLKPETMRAGQGLQSRLRVWLLSL